MAPQMEIAPERYLTPFLNEFRFFPFCLTSQANYWVFSADSGWQLAWSQSGLLPTTWAESKVWHRPPSGDPHSVSSACCPISSSLSHKPSVTVSVTIISSAALPSFHPHNFTSIVALGQPLRCQVCQPLPSHYRTPSPLAGTLQMQTPGF